MKTSKIIFISLLSTIAILILFAMLDIRINGRRKGDFRADFKVNKHVLPPFKVLSINNSMNVTLVQNDSSSIEMTYLKDSIPPKLNYMVKEDTLMLSDFEKSNHRNVSVQINANDSLNKIVLKNSNISINRLGLRKMTINMDQTTLRLNHDKKMKSFIQVLDIAAKNYSLITSSEFKIDLLELALQNSKAYLDVRVGKLSGTLTDSSIIHMRQPEEISLRRDSTSKINLNAY